MKFILYRLMLLGTFTLGACQVLAAENNLSGHPGFIDMSRLTALTDKEPNVEVNLSGAVLKMLTNLPIEEMGGGPEAAALLRVIDQVLIRIYAIDPSETEEMLDVFGDVSSEMQVQNWTRIVRVREQDDASVDIHVKVSEDGENLLGLTVMAIEGLSGRESEVVFVNIAGNFNPAYLSSLGQQLDIDYLDAVELP